MQKHIVVYFNYFGYTEADFIPCEKCGKKANDIHHIVYRSHVGKDEISNLIALCRDCHNDAHNCKISKEKLIELHKNRLNE